MLPYPMRMQRLSNQGLIATALASALAVVRHLGALQAQDYKQALWAIGARLANPHLRAVEDAISDGAILRTWAMRGTIHFVAAEDAGWMLKLCAVREISSQKRRLQQLELNDAIIGQAEAILLKALQGRKALARGHLMNLLEQQGISTEGQRGYHILWQLGQRGLLAIGPTIDNEQTFVRLDEWVPVPRDLKGDEALAELVLRFFRSHGPATEQDFARWTGLTLTETRRAIASVRQHLSPEVVDGLTYYSSVDSLIPPDSSQAVVRLLAGFDEYLIGYKDRTTVLPEAYAQRIVPGDNGVFLPFITRDGEVVGTWKRTIKTKVVKMECLPFTTFAGIEDQLAAQAESYGAFMNLPIDLHIEPAAN